MSEFRGIPVVTTGTKYQTEQGFAAIKNGVKARTDRQQAPREPKPPWLKARVPAGERFEALRATVHEHRLATVCEESICPNIGECFGKGTATFMILGDICTRRCPFCDVAHGRPLAPDAEEPRHLAQHLVQHTGHREGTRVRVTCQKSARRWTRDHTCPSAIARSCGRAPGQPGQPTRHRAPPRAVVLRAST